MELPTGGSHALLANRGLPRPWDFGASFAHYMTGMASVPGVHKGGVVPYVTKATLQEALEQLQGTAGHLLKIFLTLKHMGLHAGGQPVTIDTSNSTPSLERLFACGDAGGRMFVPFAHTKRYATMMSDASRSIVQTTIQRWATSGSVVTCDPTGFLDFYNDASGLSVAVGRNYPLGLGHGESGFALADNQRVALPALAFAVWYGRQSRIPDQVDPASFLRGEMERELHLSRAEVELLFTEAQLAVTTQMRPLSDAEIFQLCKPYISGSSPARPVTHLEDFAQYNRRLRSMTTDLDRPPWLRVEPERELKDLIAAGARAILLYGPPRTGKSRAIDRICARTDPRRETIQIHDGWGYDQLVQGLVPDEGGHWKWTNGVLLSAIQEGKSVIVLEEINRTSFTQALGELFSLIESQYRGAENSIRLRSGDLVSVLPDTLFLMTMNTVDKSTEEIDDALWGRVAAVDFPPRLEDLAEMLRANDVSESISLSLAEICGQILAVYPLGHGYFAGLAGDVSREDVGLYYRSRIRPVLANFLGELGASDLSEIDNLFSEFMER